MSQLPTIFQGDDLPEVFKGDQKVDELPKIFKSPMKDLGDVKTTQDVADLFASQPKPGFNGVPGAAPMTPFSSAGTPTSLSNWARANPTQLPERGIVGETTAGLLRSSAQAFRAPAETLATLVGAPEEVQSDIRDIFGPTIKSNAPSRSDLTGEIANFAGASLPSIFSGPLGFGTQAFNEIHDRTGSVPAAAAGGIIASALAWIPLGNLISNSVGKKLIETYGETAVRRLLIRRAEGLVSSAIIGGGTAASTEEIARAAGASPEDIGFLKNTLGMYVGHELLQLPRTLKDLTGPNPEKAQTELVKSKLISSEEATLIGSDAKLAGNVIVRRMDGEKLRLEVEDGKTVVKSEGRDQVPFDVQEKLQHDPGAIQKLRDDIKAGRASIYQDPSRLPPTMEEVAGLTASLSKLRDKIVPEVKPEEFSDQNKPVSERSLLVDDLNKQITKLQTNPTKATVLQAMALENLAPRFKDSIKPIEAWRSASAAISDSIMSEGLDMRPVSRFQLPLQQSEAKGYFNPPEKLTSDPKLQERVTTAQNRMRDEISGLVNNSKLSAVDKVMGFSMLDTEHQSRIEKILAKDTAQADTKTQVKRRLAQSKLPDPKKIEVLNALDHAFEQIAKHTSEGTPQEIEDRLGSEVANAPQEVRDLVEKLRSEKSPEPWGQLVDKYAYEEYQRRLSKGEQGTPEQDHARAEQKLRRTLVDLELGKTRNEIIKSLSGLSSENSKPFIDALRGVKLKEELSNLSKAIEVARLVEQRKSDVAYAQRTSTKLGTSMRREEVEKLLGALTPEPKAQGREVVGVRAMKLGDEVFPGRKGTEKTFEEDHAAIIERLKKENPQLVKSLSQLQLGDTDHPSFGFMTSKNRFVDRAEARRLAEVMAETGGATKPVGASAKEPGAIGTPKERVVSIDPDTGKNVINQKVLEKKLDKLTNDQLTTLVNSMRTQIREGRIEQGLENRYLKYSAKDNVRVGVAAIEKSSKLRSELKTKLDTPLHVSGMAVYPTSTELFLYQMFGSDPNARVYKILHGNLVDGNVRDYQNRADTRRYLAKGSREILDLNPETPLGQQKFLTYLSEEVSKGVTRDEAINAYLIGEDPGRQDSKTLGFVKKGRGFTREELVAKLSPEDKKFAEYLRGYLPDNPVWEKGMENFRLLKGHEVPRNDNHWPSSREPLEQGPSKSFASITASIESDADPLKDRGEGLTTPYQLKGAVSEFLRANDQMSLFAENGIKLHEATKFFYDPKVIESMLSTWGQGNRDRVESYLSNIMGTIGIQPTAFTKTINALTTSYALSRVALNPASALKQGGHIFTIGADGTVGLKSLIQSIAEGSMVRSDVDRRMIESSGLAYERYHGNFLNDLVIMNETSSGPSKLKLLQHYGLVLQRTVDRAVMRTAWRASELQAQSTGLRDFSTHSEAARLFNIVAGRDQPTANPLYSSELEVEAKRHPILRGLIMFGREQNRIFNVVSRRVGEAVQNPSPETFGRAGKAVLLGVIGNALGIASIDALRRLAYNQPQNSKTFAEDSLDSTIGLWYAGAPVRVITDTIIDPSHDHTDKLDKSPLLAIAKDAVKLLINLGSAEQAGATETKTGLHRGESKRSQALMKVADSAFSLVGGVTGLPLWGVWQQAKGMYNWSHPDYKLMVQFEQERQQLKSDGRQDSLRYQELEATRKRVNEIHQLRSSGLTTQKESQDEIMRELQRVVR